MNATAQALNAYKSTTRQAASHREVQAKVFGQITADLLAAHEAGRAAFPQMAEALNRNRKLWDLLFAEMCDDAHPYPPQLRADVVSLYFFVRNHSSKVLRGAADVRPILDINRAMAAGLLGDPGEGAGDGRA